MNKYYKILGVTEESTKEEIKSAHRNLLKKYHPDTYLGDKNFAAKKSAEINVAYAQVLADREKNGYAQPKQSFQQKNEPKQSKKAKTAPKNEEPRTRRQPYEESEIGNKVEKENTYQNQEVKKDVDYAEYAAKTAVNAESNIPELYLSQEEVKSELKSKRILDGLIISLSIVTIVLVLLIIFL